MACDRRPFSLGTADPRRWTPPRAAAALSGGHSLGLEDRRPLERFTKVFSLVPHLLATAPGVDRFRRVPEGVGAVPAETRRAGTTRLAGDLRRCDVRFGKKRGVCVGKTKRGKGTKLLTLIDGQGTPVAVDIASASPHEVTLIETLLTKRVVRRKPRRLIYDTAADSDPLRQRLARRGIELICPHRKNRTRPKTQDGRKLRRYRRRWKVERTISWLQNFRRLVVRYEHHAHLFLGFAQLACLFTTLQRF